MNPPASSKSPTSRKKPRIMRHLIYVCRARGRSEPLTGRRGKFNLISTLTYRRFRPGFLARGGPEGVDAARRALYKGANGGGGNPPAAAFAGGRAGGLLLSPAG